MPRLVVLDALGLIYRAFYAMISRPLRNSRGENTSAIYGFANMVLRLRREYRPDRWALAWDGPGPTFRHERFPEYKATRPPMPGELVSQIAPIEELALCLGLPLIEKPGMEADDVMATLARRGEEQGYEVLLVTGDKDMLQVVSEQVTVLWPQARGEDYLRMDPAAVDGKWGVSPAHIRDVLALMGDSSDNIPGVPGVGEKTAVELMRRFGSLDELYDRLSEVARPALKQKLETNRDLAYLSRELATVQTDLDLGLAIDALAVAPIRREELLAFARRWEIRRLEALAGEPGVEAPAAGAVATRPMARRGTAAEAPGAGVALATTPARAAAAVSAPPASALPLIPEIPLAAPAAAAFAPPARADRELQGAVQGALDLWGTAAEVSPGTHDERIARIHAVRARALHGLALLPLSGGDDPRSAPLVRSEERR